MPTSPARGEEKHGAGIERKNSATSVSSERDEEEETNRPSSIETGEAMFTTVMGHGARLIQPPSREGSVFVTGGLQTTNARFAPGTEISTAAYVRNSKNLRPNHVDSTDTAIEHHAKKIVMAPLATEHAQQAPSRLKHVAATISSEADSEAAVLGGSSGTIVKAPDTHATTSSSLVTGTATSTPAPHSAVAVTTGTIGESATAASTQVSSQLLLLPATEETAEDVVEMSVDELVPQKKPRRKRTSSKTGQSAGRWTHEEHQAFLRGLRECGREWKKVAMRIPTRTSAQIRSHAQKYFSKLQRDQESSVSMVQQEGGSTASASQSTVQALSSSVQRHAERIVANPHAAQREVETTLDALRERYRQLQASLEERLRRHRAGEDPPAVQGGRGNDGFLMPVHRRKRTMEEFHRRSQELYPRAAAADDQSSVSSAVSVSVASLGNDELVALHVLGGSLPRGDSSTEGNAEAPDAASASSSDSSVDSATSAADEEQKQEAKRARMD